MEAPLKVCGRRLLSGNQRPRLQSMARLLRTHAMHVLLRSAARKRASRRDKRRGLTPMQSGWPPSRGGASGHTPCTLAPLQGALARCPPACDLHAACSRCSGWRQPRWCQRQPSQPPPRATRPAPLPAAATPQAATRMAGMGSCTSLNPPRPAAARAPRASVRCAASARWTRMQRRAAKAAAASVRWAAAAMPGAGLPQAVLASNAGP